ncbi:MAG: hypothetical protein U1C72_00405, partial [Candidatus Pacearchaeota archaeon]|nr:hypothetical protein [Candidatus Pacearchaeota archaeon]
MTTEFFKKKYGYETEGMWMPRVTAITALVSKPFFAGALGFADWGNLVHSSVEKILKGEPGVAEERIAPSLYAFEKWRKAQEVTIHNPTADIEAKVYDFENGYA